MPLICGEVGISTEVYGELAQARFFERFLTRMGPRLQGMNIWMWQDFGPEGEQAGEQQRSFGIRRADGTAKPAGRVIQQAFD